MGAGLEEYFTGCLYFTVNSLARSLTRMTDEEFARLGLSSSQAFLLMLVLERPGISQKEACEELNLAQSTVSRFTDALIRRGFLEKRSMGKQVEIYPSSEAEKVIEKLHQAWKSLHKRYNGLLGEELADKLTSDTAAAGRVLAESEKA